LGEALFQVKIFALLVGMIYHFLKENYPAGHEKSSSLCLFTFRQGCRDLLSAPGGQSGRTQILQVILVPLPGAKLP
jgi:hypothetical protein